ncbi:hypothetical protein LBMAG24_02690 [Bacteroidota bacterium]|nr:hypothetical protein LBMAG24_02690 [Bacteroidota bacterium]
MILITTSLLWILFFFILLDSLGANSLRKQAISIAKTLYVDGPCLRIRVKGHFVSKKGQKTPLEGKLYINTDTKQYIFYADLTYQIIYAEKWLFTHNTRSIYRFSSFRKVVPGPFSIDFFPYLFSKKGINAPLLYKNEKEEGRVITWRELENETIPRWISHSFSSLGLVNMEITLYAEDSSFLWW